jgi:hypothetical protein
MNGDKYFTALAIIRDEYATHGHKTKRSVQVAVGNRIKRRAREKAIERGLRIYENRRGYQLDEKR